MEVYARNLRSVPQSLSSVLGDMSDRRRLRSGGALFTDKLDDELVCPKPRRPPPCNAPRRTRSSTPRGGDTGFEVLDIFLSKSSYGDASSFGCSPPYFSGSPPARAGNPLVRDVQFVHQRVPATPAATQQGVREAARGFSPCIRVEGFTSSAADTISAVA